MTTYPRKLPPILTLPQELRDEIWTDALSHIVAHQIPGVVLRADDFSPFCPDDFQVRNHIDSATHTRAITRRWKPEILSVHRDVYFAARRLGLIHDHVKFPSHTVWFNPAKDALFFSPNLLAFWPSTRRPEHMSLLSKARRVVVQESSVVEGFRVVAEETKVEEGCDAFRVLANPSQFPDIQNLIILERRLELTRPIAISLSHEHFHNSPKNFPDPDALVFLPFRGFSDDRTIVRIRTVGKATLPFTHHWVIDRKSDPGAVVNFQTRLETRWLAAWKCYIEERRDMAFQMKQARVQNWSHDALTAALFESGYTLSITQFTGVPLWDEEVEL